MEQLLYWIDDQESLLKNSIPNFKQEGLSVKGEYIVERAKNEISKNLQKYNCIFLDLEFNHKLNGLDFYRQIRGLDKNIPIIIISAKLDVHEWNVKLISFEKELNEKLVRISKPLPITTSQEFRKIKEMIIKKIQYYDSPKYEILIDKEMQNDTSLLDVNIIDPFSLKLEEFLELSDKEIHEANKLASERTKHFRKEYFLNNPNIDWIVISENPNNIIRSGAYQNMPNDQDLIKLAKTLDAPVYGYARPKIIEQAFKKWTRIKNDDYYPTITLISNSHSLQADFDTGSPYSFLSYEYLVEKTIITPRTFGFTSEEEIFGKEYRFYKEKLEFVVNCVKEISKPVTIDIEAVVDWVNSPLTFHYKNRIGLIGRNLLLRNRLKLILDGKNLITEFL